MAEQKQNTQLAKAEPTMAERFTGKVVALFNNNVGELALTNFQKRLAQNYYIAVDAALKMAEEKRKKKSAKYQDPVPVIWANVNLDALAQDVVAAARIGLDPAQPNHISPIPFKNNTIGKYEIMFLEGYRGKELKAKKYGLEVPDHVIVELVYSNDKFKSHKKDRNNKIESFDFEVVNDFDRGEIVGGFYYHIYSNNPEKNKLVVFTKKDIEKRKPAYASAEFWGGEKDVWENGKKVGKETVEGWYEKMCWKTIYRAAYNDITTDSQKIDDDFLRLRRMEESFTEERVEQEIVENANGDIIDIEPDVIDEPMQEQGADMEPEQEQDDGQMSLDDGPEF